MVRRPEKLAIKYSFRAAQHSGAFVQLPLRPADAFGKAAKERGVDLSFGQSLREKLEELDEVGALCPVLFERAGEPVLREEHEFVPWAEYRVSEDYDTRTKPRYCHWQLLYVKDAVSLGQPRFRSTGCSTTTGARR